MRGRRADSRFAERREFLLLIESLEPQNWRCARTSVRLRLLKTLALRFCRMEILESVKALFQAQEALCQQNGEKRGKWPFFARIVVIPHTQPFVALAVRLRQAGHHVILAARPDFADLAAEYGVEFAPLGHPYQPFITGAARTSALGGGHLLHQLRYGLAQRRYVSDHLNQDAWRAAQGAEAILYKYSWITGYSLAEKLGIPCAAAMFFPLTPTRAFPSFLIGRGIDRGPLLNRLIWSLSEQVVWQLLRPDDTKLRRELGIRPLPFFGPLRRQQCEEMPVY